MRMTDPEAVVAVAGAILLLLALGVADQAIRAWIRPPCRNPLCDREGCR